jgi:hypothetical protein
MNVRNVISRLTRVAAALSATVVEAAIFWAVMPK